MGNNRNKHSGGVSCSACSAFIISCFSDSFTMFYCILSEPQHDKTNKMTCAPSKDSDQPWHWPSLISLRCPHEEFLVPLLPTERTAETHQAGQIPRLI